MMISDRLAIERSEREDEIQRLRDALAAYADPDNWVSSGIGLRVIFTKSYPSWQLAAGALASTAKAVQE
jgi:hypothetical protein